jgi:hypothetical protein
MMSQFDQRRNGFEGQFAHDEELEFKAKARRNKWLGHWAAQKLGLNHHQAEDYAAKLVAGDVSHIPDADIFAKIKADFEAGHVQQSDHQIHRTMDEFLAKARHEIHQSG